MAVLGIKSSLHPLFQSDLDKDFVYSQLDLIPYRGNDDYSSHASLQLYYDLAELSPSYNICINELKRTAFAGDMDLSKSGRLGLKTDPEDLLMTRDEKLRYVDGIESVGVTLPQINELIQSAFEHYKISGVAYIHYIESMLGDARKISMKIIDTRNGMIIRRKRRNSPILLFVMPKFITQYSTSFQFFSAITKKVFRQIPVYPFFRNRKTFRETVFMFKKGGLVYGTPDTVGTIRDQWIEYALTELSAKISGSEFVCTKLLTYQAKEATSDARKEKKKFDQLSINLKNAMTNKGEASSLVIIKVPPNIGLDFEDLTFSRDSTWYKTQLDKACNNIYAANGVYKQLTGAEQAKANLGGNILMDLMTVYDHKIINGYQRDFSNFFMPISNEIVKFAKLNGLENTKLVFPKTIDDIKENLSGSPNIAEQIGSLIEQ